MFLLAANAGLVAFLLVSLIVGVRLMLLARRTGGYPELLIGTGFVLGGALGYVPEVLAADGMLPEAFVPIVIVISNGAIRACAVLTAFFTWRVFRPTDRRAEATAWTIAALLAISYVAFPAPWSMATGAAEWGWSLVTASARTVAFAWAAWESLRYWRQTRRRAALGIVDATTTRRLLLWGLAMVGVSAMSLMTLLYRILPSPGPDAAWTLVQSALGLFAAIAMAWAFAPRRRPSEHGAATADARVS